MTPLVARSAWALLALCIAAPLRAAPAPVPVPVDSSAAAPAPDLRLPADIVFLHHGAPDSAVVFRHASHVTAGEGACLGCHNGAYPLLHRGPAPDHRAMNAGGSCGGCHDGKRAFGVRDPSACGTCHAGVASATGATAPGPKPTLAALRLPAAHAYAQGDGSPGQVTFRHKTHARSADDCARCHPTPFRRMATPALPDGAMHDKAACGSCHDGKKTFATDDDATCARCHKETGARP